MSDTLLAIEDYSGGFRSETGEFIPVLHGVSYRLKTGWGRCSASAKSITHGVFLIAGLSTRLNEPLGNTIYPPSPCASPMHSGQDNCLFDWTNFSLVSTQ